MVWRSLLYDLRRLPIYMGEALQIPPHQAVVSDWHPDL